MSKVRMHRKIMSTQAALTRATVLFCLLISGCTVVHAETTPADPVRAKAPGEPNPLARMQRVKDTLPEFKPVELKLKAGERLDYEIKVGGVPAGKSLMEVVREETWPNGAPIWRIQHFTRANRAVSLFYGVTDKHISAIDQKSGFSRSFRLELHEGDVKADEKINMNYDIGEMKASFERTRADGKVREYTLPLLDKVLDPLAAIYYLRSMDFTKFDGSEFYLPICTDRRVWNTRIRVFRQGATMDVGKLKNRRVVILEPEVEFRGLFERRGPMKIWIDEETGVPLRMTCEIPIGQAEVILEDWSEESPFGPKK